MMPAQTYASLEGRSVEQLVLEHASLVKRIAYHLIGRLPASVDVEDLIQAGMIGLLGAAGKYSVDGGANFSTFAGIRIRGAMLDEVRKLDWTPRSVHRRMREMSRAIAEIEHREGRDARDHEIASARGVSRDVYHSLLPDAASARLARLEELSADGALLRRAGEEIELHALDLVVPTRPMVAVCALGEALKALDGGPAVFEVGDCREPRTAFDAMQEAAALGHRL